MPQVTSKKFSHDCDEINPFVTFKDSKYYAHKHHLDHRGAEQRIKVLNKKIDNLAEHNRRRYDLSPNI